MTAFSTTDRAIEATKKGAFDYLIKPFEMPEMLEVIHKAVASHRLTAKPITLGSVDPEKDAIIGTSRKMQEVFKEIGRIADKPVPVLIKGETGTGKELIARAIYQHGSRADQPFIAINCAAIPENLIESELFGHERGAFTNAVARRIGRFEQANKGTLFLDEVGDLPWETQVKLLRVLQEKIISRVGGKDDIPVDVRILAATHRNVDKLIAVGKFREDLFYRLNGAVVELPPLRERKNDIPPLVHYFLEKLALQYDYQEPSLHKDALRVLQDHDWPGNVRQLENVVRKALIDSRGYTISEEIIRDALEDSYQRISTGDDSGSGGPAERESLPPVDGFSDHVRNRILAASRGEIESAYETLVEDLEREVYRHAVDLSHGHQTNMAKWLGVSRLTVREKLDKFELFPKRGKKKDGD